MLHVLGLHRYKIERSWSKASIVLLYLFHIEFKHKLQIWIYELTKLVTGQQNSKLLTYDRPSRLHTPVRESIIYILLFVIKKNIFYLFYLITVLWWWNKMVYYITLEWHTIPMIEHILLSSNAKVLFSRMSWCQKKLRATMATSLVHIGGLLSGAA